MLKLYNITGPLYLETDSFGNSLGAGLLQVTDGMDCRHDNIPNNAKLCLITFTSKNLSRMEWYYNNIEHKAHRILHGLETFHQYCFVREICTITDHKPLVAILSKDFTIMCQQLQQIMLRMPKYSMHIIYKPQEIAGMGINVNAITL